MGQSLPSTVRRAWHPFPCHHMPLSHVTIREIRRCPLSPGEGQGGGERTRAFLNEAKEEKVGKTRGVNFGCLCAGGCGRGRGATSECSMCMCVIVTGAEGKEQLAGLGEAWLPLKDLPHSSGPDSLEPSLILEMIIQ